MKTPLLMTTTLIRKVSMGNEIQDVIRADLTVENFRRRPGRGGSGTMAIPTADSPSANGRPVTKSTTYPMHQILLILGRRIKSRGAFFN